MKQSVLRKEKSPKEVLDEVYISSGDVAMARSVGELPRGPTDIYNARRCGKQTATNAVPSLYKNGGKVGDSPSSSTSVVRVGNVWTLLERAS